MAEGRRGRGNSDSPGWTPILILAAALVLLYLFWNILLVFILAGFLAFIIHPLVEAFPKFVPRVVSILIVYIILLLLLAVGISILTPVLSQQYDELVNSIPQYIEEVREFVNGLQLRYLDLPAEWRTVVDQALSELQGYAIGLTQQTIPAVVAVLTGLFALVLIPLLAFFMLLGDKGYKQLLIAVVPERGRDSVEDLLACTGGIFWRFIRGEFFLMLIVGFMTGFGLYFVGMPYSAVIGIIAGILELIPNFGPLIVSILVGIVGLLIDPILALKAVAVTMGVQALENSILVPLIMGRTVGLNPLTVAFAVFLGGSLGGVVGAILAIPIAMIIKIYILYFYADPEELPEGEAAICRSGRRKKPSRGKPGKQARARN